MPSFKSVDTVKAVHLASSFLATMSGSRSSSARAPSIAQQITPDECLPEEQLLSRNVERF